MGNFICDIFIIETLHPDDEGNGRLEGVVLSSILHMDLKKPIYRYVRTKQQFQEALLEYKKSKYRYLHISAHGDKNEIELTNGECYSHNQLSNLLSDCSKSRRLFISSCYFVNQNFAKELSKHCQFNSVIGPSEKLLFSEAALLWASFYHVLFKIDDTRMSSKYMKKTALTLKELYNVKIEFYKFDKHNHFIPSKLI